MNEQHEPVEMTAIECRVVGALIEKAATTPDVYPMTTNALVSACNQKTNRDPVVSYDAVTIDGALLELRQRNLVRRVHTPGSRSTKHRHTLDEALALDPGELAVVSVLLLRGPQTVGELRQRTERQHGFESLDAVDACLDALASRATPVVRQLARQPGQKEARWQHLIGDADEALAASVGATVPTPAHALSPSSPTPSPAHSAAASTAATAQPSPSASPSATSAGPALDTTALVERVAELEGQVATLRSQLTRLAASLGESLDE